MHHHRTYLSPADPPTADLAGTDHDIPTLTFAAGYTSEVCISLGVHPDPVGYLRDLAALCIGLAEQVEARATAQAAAGLEVCS